MCQEVSVVYMKLFEYSTNKEISTSKDPMALSFWSWQVMILVGVSIFYNPIILPIYHHFFSSQKKKKNDSSVQWALQGRIHISSNPNFVHFKKKKSLTLNNNLNLLSLSSGHCYRCHSLRSKLGIYWTVKMMFTLVCTLHSFYLL